MLSSEQLMKFFLGVKPHVFEKSQTVCIAHPQGNMKVTLFTLHPSISKIEGFFT